MGMDGFTEHRIEVNGVTIALETAGDGPPVLMLHGYPQTRHCWHRVAPKLAERFTVVCSDLRGYGASDKPEGGGDHAAYAKRTMAADQVAVMTALGHERFAVIGHDRGGRVAHRMALDFPKHVARLAVLDIVPTLRTFEAVDRGLAHNYYHWFFLAQPAPLPEKLIAADPRFYVDWTLGGWGTGLDQFDAAALDAYRAAFEDPAMVHAACEDYRAAAGIDLDHDRDDIDRKVTCPTLALWGTKGIMEKHFDVAATWRERCHRVKSAKVDAGHFVAEEKPEETAEALVEFLDDWTGAAYAPA